MAILSFKVKNGCIYETKESVPVANSIGYIDASVTFDNEDEWDGLNRWITFDLNHEEIYQLELSKNSDGTWCTEKKLDLERAGTYDVSVHGTITGDTQKRIPTHPCRVVVKKSGSIYGQTLTPGTPTAMEQLETVAKSKVGHVEYDDSNVYFYTDSTKETLVATVPISTGSSTGGMTEAQVKALIESYGYVIASDLTVYAKASDVYTKSEVDAKDSVLSEAIVRLDERATDIEGKEETWDDASAKSHEHSNKSILDIISDAWTTAVNWVTTNGQNVLNHLSNTAIHATESDKTKWNAKQDAISDLADIRSGASKGATALQSVPSTYRTAEEQDAIDAELSEELARHESLIDVLYKEQFDGTTKTYNRLMKEWFLNSGADTATPAELTVLCDEWYTRTRTGWNGYVTFAQPDVSTVSTGAKGGDNADMVCEPSTNDVAGQDDYAGLPQFACKDCNWVLTDDGDIQITAIDGITSNFERYNPEVYVGVLQMSMLHYWYEDEASYTHGITDDLSDDSYENARPYPEAIKLDGTVRSWVCHGKYMSQEVNGKMTCCAGLVPSESLYSHNALATKSKANGAYYSGGTVTDWSFLVLMTFIKYGSMSLDGIIQGCVSYYNQIPVSVASDNVNYVIVSNSNASKILIGSTIRIGSSNTYGNASSYDISDRYGRIVKSKEAYDDSNMLIHISGDAISTLTTSYVTTWHWQSGTNDNVLGNDGGCIASTNDQCTAKLQGIEFAVGGYEVFGDAILYLDGENYCPYVVTNATKQKSGATISTNGYEDSGLRSTQPATDSWCYISKLEFDGREFFQGGTSNGSSSKFCKDAFYKNSVNAKSVYRELLAFGRLGTGSGNGGLSSLSGDRALGVSDWYVLARLSPNGNRGELTA